MDNKLSSDKINKLLDGLKEQTEEVNVDENEPNKFDEAVNQVVANLMGYVKDGSLPESVKDAAHCFSYVLYGINRAINHFDDTSFKESKFDIVNEALKVMMESTDRDNEMKYDLIAVPKEEERDPVN